MTTPVVSIAKWSEYQHYKDRSAPWIKLHREILSGETWVLGTDLSRLLQVASTLLAARYENAIPLNFTLWKRVLSLDCSEREFDAAIHFLVSSSFFVCQELAAAAATAEQRASTTLASCSSEGEREAEAEGETETRARVRDDDSPEGLRRIQAAYPKRAGRQPYWITVAKYLSIAISEHGATWDELEAAAKRYAAYVRATGKEGTETCMKAETFFGSPEQLWRQAWDVPRPTAAPARGGGSAPKTADQIAEDERLAKAAEASKRRYLEISRA